MSAAFGITDTIGNTPLVKLKNIVPANCADIYVKLEYFNPTGSYKDRMAQAIIEEAESRGDLKPGMTVIECTGGSTGTSLAFICAAKGYRFVAVTSNAFAKEKLQSIRSFGGEVEIVFSESGKITPDLIPKMMDKVREMSAQSGNYWTRQFENKDALIGYGKLGDEIRTQLQQPIDIFCAAIGTASMFTGVTKALKRHLPNIQTIELEPASSPLLSQGIKGTHGVEGIGVGFVPTLLQEQPYDDIMTVDETKARDMARLLAAREGIFAGISTGLNVAAAIAIGAKLGPGHTIVTVAVDSGMKYLAGGLFD